MSYFTHWISYTGPLIQGLLEVITNSKTSITQANQKTLSVLRNEERKTKNNSENNGVSRCGGRTAKLVRLRPFKKNLNLTFIGLNRTLKIQSFDDK